MVLTPGVEDRHLWTPSPSGEFSTKSAYRRFFVGSIDFEPWKDIWKTWAPPRCRYFIWLVALNRCCPLCDQEDENVQHLLTACVLSRQVWYSVLSLVGLQQHTPGLDALSFIEWWRHAMQQIEKQHRKGFN